MKRKLFYIFLLILSGQYSRIVAINTIGSAYKEWQSFTAENNDSLKVLTIPPISTFNSITFKGMFMSKYTNTSIITFFEYSPDQRLLESGNGLVSDTFIQEKGVKSGVFSFTLNTPKIQTDINYYIRAVAQVQTSNGDILKIYGNTTVIKTTINSIVKKKDSLNTIIKPFIKDISSNSAIIDGYINPNGQETTAWYELPSKDSIGISEFPANLEKLNEMLPYILKDLLPNTKYKYRIVAVNKYGISKCDWMYFTTPNSDSTFDYFPKNWIFDNEKKYIKLKVLSCSPSITILSCEELNPFIEEHSVIFTYDHIKDSISECIEILKVNNGNHSLYSFNLSELFNKTQKDTVKVFINLIPNTFNLIFADPIIFVRKKSDKIFLNDSLEVYTKEYYSTNNSITFNGEFTTNFPDHNITTYFEYSTDKNMVETRNGNIAGQITQSRGLKTLEFKATLEIPENLQETTFYWRAMAIGVINNEPFCCSRYGQIKTAKTTPITNDKTTSDSIKLKKDSIKIMNYSSTSKQQFPSNSQLKVYERNRTKLEAQIKKINNKINVLKTDIYYSKIDFKKIEDIKIYFDDIDKNIKKASLEEIISANCLMKDLNSALKILIRKRKFLKDTLLYVKIKYLFINIKALHDYMINDIQATIIEKNKWNEDCGNRDGYPVIVNAILKENTDKENINQPRFRVNYCYYYGKGYGTNSEKKAMLTFSRLTSPTSCENVISGDYLFWLTDESKSIIKRYSHYVRNNMSNEKELNKNIPEILDINVIQ